ncbi:hypothetical protein KIW84_012908 [Lathyrus oleraceus]|uniref:Uncharacterized protein n=1 Tax=Pisum sativum TaxID=3888 RepID=A0A9D5BIZ2_PEA|nr:hypothetical protein KIW84_012908 [Pisum sativum]
METLVAAQNQPLPEPIQRTLVAAQNQPLPEPVDTMKSPSFMPLQDIQGLLDTRTITVVHPKNLENNVNVIIPQFNIPKLLEITFDSHNSANSPLVIYLPGPTPYQSDKSVPYKYQATMIRDGMEVPLPFMLFVSTLPM